MVDVSLTSDSLEAVDVVAVYMWNQSVREVEALSGVSASGRRSGDSSLPGWWWLENHPGLDLAEDHVGNQLLARLGIGWANYWVEVPSTGSFSGEPSPNLTHAGMAFDAIEADAGGRRTLTALEINQATNILDLTVGCLPGDNLLIRPRLHGLVSGNHHWPSAGRSVSETDMVPRLAASLFVREQSRTPPVSVRAHPAAQDFPGPVLANAARVTRTITIDTAVDRWYSTGLYAAPGELVTVTVPAEVAKAGGFQV